MIQIKDRLLLKPQIIELNESNAIYMTLTMCILTNQTNLNKVRFTDEFIKNVVANKEDYIGIPLVVNRKKLESGLYNNLTHEFNKSTGTLGTDIIGSFVDFWEKEGDDGSLQLMGSARIMKRFPNVCNAISELYSKGELEFSCECLVSEYASVTEDEKVIDANGGFLMGNCIVSHPAEVRAKAELLIAEAIEQDLKGGEVLEKEFNGGKEIQYHFETSSIKLSDIGNQIYNQLNPIDPKSGNREYNYYVLEVYNDHVIVEDWNNYKVLYKIPYTIQNDTVVLDSKDNWIKGRMGFIPDGVEVASLLVAEQRATEELNNKIVELNNKHREVLTQMEGQLKELQEKIDKLTKDLETSNSLVTSLQEQITKLEEDKNAILSENEELKQFKEKVLAEQKEQLKKELSEKYAKLLSKEVFESEEVKKAIEACDTNKLNALVVAEVAKKATKEDNKGKGEIVTFASKQEDLIPTSKRDYLLAEVEDEE